MIGLYEELEKTLDESIVQQILEEHPEIKILWNRRKSLKKPAIIDREDVILHVIFEAVVEKQIQDNDPAEVREAYQKLIQSGLAPHAARGNIVKLFRWHLDQGLREKKPFDHQSYTRRLQFLGHNPHKTERNQACPCGSGKKYKKCCLSCQDLLEVYPKEGALILGSGAYLAADYYKKSEYDPRRLQVENRVHLASFLESLGDFEGALFYLQENAAVFEQDNDKARLEDALQDVLFFCSNLPEYLEIGLKVVDQLIDLTNSIHNQGLYRCDKADLLAQKDGVDKGEQEFSKIFHDLPQFSFAHFRYANFLNLYGQKEKALTVLKKLVNQPNLDKMTLEAANELLKDLSPTQSNADKRQNQ